MTPLETEWKEMSSTSLYLGPMSRSTFLNDSHGFVYAFVYSPPSNANANAKQIIKIVKKH
jgi:hypothetical protein